MFETGTLIARANTLFGDADRLVEEYNESKAMHIAACLADLKRDIEFEKNSLYQRAVYRLYETLENEDQTRSICILNGLLPLVELSKAAVKRELKVYKVVRVRDGDEYEVYTGYNLEEARKAVKNNSYEIRIYTPWKPIELMNKNDLEELFDEGGLFAEYEIYKEANA